MDRRADIAPPFAVALLLALVALVALGVGGCGGSTPPPAGMASLTLGSAALDGSGFLPLDGDQTLVAGAQGGFHVWLKYRVAGMAPTEVEVHREAHRVSDDTLVLRTDGTQQIGAASADGYWELPTALPSFMCPTPIGVNVIDERIEFDVTLSTPDGAPLATGSAEATVHCPTGDQLAFCQRICAG